ncbi:universal stress protein [Mycolicibacterium tusciae]|uniref:Universal stress protein UspA n=1 Tax=Mycolicibacterium tusciae TaxID=75922 RepID=A0A1X0JM53_9MYCO|nr:universal stress protein [Mycolicibacterium tusciae]ORB63882.1 universal stress protein UspA [Mycolicibacterium tusciae]
MSTRIVHHGVVVGADGSGSSQGAVRWAAREAVMRHTCLTIVHIADSISVPASTLAWPGGRVPDEVLEIQESDARNVIAEAICAAQGAAPGERPDIDSELLFGKPVPSLVDLSKDAQMVVVGRRGRTGRHQRLLGSVSSGLIHHAHCPVAVINDEGSSLSPSSARLPVLVGVDGSQASESALAIAFDEASWRAVDLVALRVLWNADVSPLRMERSDLRRVAEKTLAETLAAWKCRYPEVNVRVVVEFEDPARRLLEQSETAQLAVVGNRGRGAIAEMLLGSVSSALAKDAPTPVLVARQR